MYHVKGAGGAINKRQVLDHIRLLCRCGAGLEAIVAPLCAAVISLIGAQSGSLFWLDEESKPYGFYHDSAPAALKDLFIFRYDELFAGPDEINMERFTQIEGPSIGRMLDPDFRAQFMRGNIQKYLCDPLGHQHMLDIRVEWRGIGRALFCAWNPLERPFTRADADALIGAQSLMQGAIGGERPDAQWRSQSDKCNAHFITDLEGRRLVSINPDAEAMLMESHLLGQGISMTAIPNHAPGFATLLAHKLAGDASPSAFVPVSGGRIMARASKTRVIDVDGAEQLMMFVSLDLQVALDALRVGYLNERALTPLQREIALFAMQGGARAQCESEFGVHSESLKKHVRAIFSATETARWTDLADVIV
jgi:hypothetical protein